MKSAIIVFFLLRCIPAIGQNKDNSLVGSYMSYFGEQIKLNADSTFSYSWRFDLASSWSDGTWRLVNDTLCLKVVAVYDTVKLQKPNGKIVDSLVLSNDRKPEVVSANDAI